MMKRGIVLFLLYGSTYFLSAFGPVLIKKLLTGSAGPNTYFLSQACLCPLAFLWLGWKGGRRAVLLHCALLIGAGLFVWAKYPQAAPMNFERQIVFELASVLPALYLAGYTARLTTGALNSP